MKPAFKNLSSSIRTFQAELTAADAQRRKAAQTAVRVEGNRLSKVLKAEITAGAPGGARFKALSVIAKKLGRGAEGRTPLKRLAIPVRYWVVDGSNRFSVKVGYQADYIMTSAGRFYGGKDQEDGSSSPLQQRSRLSASWLNIVKNTVSGKTFAAGPFNKRSGPYDQWQARTKIVWNAFGGQIGKKKLKRGREKFLLRKSTSSLRIPARPIIDPFWAKHQREAMANIERNFMAKMAGQRI